MYRIAKVSIQMIYRDMIQSPNQYEVNTLASVYMSQYIFEGTIYFGKPNICVKGV